MGRANGRYFLNTLSIGLADTIVREAAPALKRSPRVLAYGLALPRALLRHRAFRARLVAGERVVDVRTHQVVVASGTHIGIGGFNLAAGPGASIDARRLIVFTLAGATRWQLLRRSLRLVLSRHAADPEARYFTTAALTIVAHPRQAVRLDGEPAEHTPVAVEQDGEALRVFAPASFVEAPDRRSGASRARGRDAARSGVKNSRAASMSR